MPYSREDLVQRIGRRLGCVGDGQPLEAEDAAKIRDALPSIVADLDIRNVVAVSDLDAVPDAAFLFLVDVVASRLAGESALQQDEILTLASTAQVAEQRLRQHNSLPLSGAPVRAHYF